MNLSDLILIDRDQPPMSVDLAMQFGILAPFAVPGQTKRYVRDDDDDDEPAPPKANSLSVRREEQRLRRESIHAHLKAYGQSTAEHIGTAVGVNRSTAYDDLKWLHEAKRVTPIRRDGKMYWRAR